jgi:hypothetical protein
MSVEEYWIGRGIDYSRIWHDYEDGVGYMAKYRSVPVHLIRIELDQFSKSLPLFNHEAVYKTFKGYFHDLKELCLSPDEYDQALPLFIYSVERGSGIWTFIGELRQLLMFGTTLADEKLVGQKLDNMDKRLALIQKYFKGAANPKDFAAFMKARTPRQLEAAFQRLIAQGIRKVEVSTEPFEGDIEDTQRSLLDLKKLLGDADGGAG